MIKKKYVAYDTNTYEFLGFYSEGRPDMPSPVDEVNVNTFISDKGQNTHYSPNIGFYTPTDVLEAQLTSDNRNWRDGQLSLTDKFMLSDWPISSVDKQTVIQYRQELRNYPETWIRPELGAFVG